MTETLLEDAPPEEREDSNTLAIVSRAELDMQIATAKRWPRSLAKAKQRMIEMATADAETAESCFYSLKRTDRDGKATFITGPSVRLAEIALSAWGNVRSGARIISEDDRFIVAQGVCHDLEANVFSSIEVRRRITNKFGKKYGDDMVGVTANAACSIALRNAVYKVVPKVYVNSAFEAARKVAAGDSKTIGERRQACIEAFGKIYVEIPRIMQFLDKPGGGIEDITNDDLLHLRGVLTAIRDGETTIEEAFPIRRESDDVDQRPLAEKIAERKKHAQTSVPKQPAPAPSAPTESAPSDSGVSSSATSPGQADAGGGAVDDSQIGAEESQPEAPEDPDVLPNPCSESQIVNLILQRKPEWMSTAVAAVHVEKSVKRLWVPKPWEKLARDTQEKKWRDVLAGKFPWPAQPEAAPA